MQDGSKVAYADANIPPMLKEKYAEVEDYLRINSLVPQYCKYGGEIYHDITFISGKINQKQKNDNGVTDAQ